MKDYSKYKRQFVQLSRAWYGETCLRDSDVADKITTGLYAPDGGTVGEFDIRWIDLGLDSLSPKIEAFDDSWGVLWDFRDILEKLAELDDTDPTPEEICKLLLSCGFEDATQEKSPYSTEAL